MACGHPTSFLNPNWLTEDSKYFPNVSNKHFSSIFDNSGLMVMPLNSSTLGVRLNECSFFNGECQALGELRRYVARQYHEVAQVCDYQK